MYSMCIRFVLLEHKQSYLNSHLLQMHMLFLFPLKNQSPLKGGWRD